MVGNELHPCKLCHRAFSEWKNCNTQGKRCDGVYREEVISDRSNSAKIDSTRNTQTGDVISSISLLVENPTTHRVF